MDPRDYTNQPTPNENVDPSLKSWFDSIPSTEPPLEPPTPQPSSRKRWILIGLAGFVGLALVGGTAFVLISSAPSVGACLTDAHYESLTGVSLDEKLSPKDDFYTHAFDFVPGSSEYAQGAEELSDDFIKKLGAFYERSSKDTSIVITVASSYDRVNDSETAAQQRIGKLKDALQRQGIPEAAVKTVDPTGFSSDGELSDDSEELKVAKAYLSITSDARCSQ